MIHENPFDTRGCIHISSIQGRLTERRPRLLIRSRYTSAEMHQRFNASKSSALSSELICKIASFKLPFSLLSLSLSHTLSSTNLEKHGSSSWELFCGATMTRLGTKASCFCLSVKRPLLCVRALRACVYIYSARKVINGFARKFGAPLWCCELYF